MKRHEEKLSAYESLAIITDMISQAKGNVMRNSFFFLFWGWIIVIANLGAFFLIQIDYPYPYYVWAITIPAWIYTLYKSIKMSKGQQITTHLDKINGAVWISFGIVIFTFVIFGKLLNYQLNPLILTITAVPTFVTGIILRFRPLLVGGFLFWILGSIAFLIPTEYQNLVGAIAVTSGYLVPGYMLKNKKNQHV